MHDIPPHGTGDKALLLKYRSAIENRSGITITQDHDRTRSTRKRSGNAQKLIANNPIAKKQTKKNRLAKSMPLPCANSPISARNLVPSCSAPASACQ